MAYICFECGHRALTRDEAVAHKAFCPRPAMNRLKMLYLRLRFWARNKLSWKGYDGPIGG